MPLEPLTCLYLVACYLNSVNEFICIARDFCIERKGKGRRGREGRKREKERERVSEGARERGG